MQNDKIEIHPSLIERYDTTWRRFIIRWGVIFTYIFITAIVFNLLANYLILPTFYTTTLWTIIGGVLGFCAYLLTPSTKEFLYNLAIDWIKPQWLLFLTLPRSLGRTLSLFLVPLLWGISPLHTGVAKLLKWLGNKKVKAAYLFGDFGVLIKLLQVVNKDTENNHNINNNGRDDNEDKLKNNNIKNKEEFGHYELIPKLSLLERFITWAVDFFDTKPPLIHKKQKDWYELEKIRLAIEQSERYRKQAARLVSLLIVIGLLGGFTLSISFPLLFPVHSLWGCIVKSGLYGLGITFGLPVVYHLSRHAVLMIRTFFSSILFRLLPNIGTVLLQFMATLMKAIQLLLVTFVDFPRMLIGSSFLLLLYIYCLCRGFNVPYINRVKAPESFLELLYNYVIQLGITQFDKINDHNDRPYLEITRYILVILFKPFFTANITQSLLPDHPKIIRGAIQYHYNDILFFLKCMQENKQMLDLKDISVDDIKVDNHFEENDKLEVIIGGEKRYQIPKSDWLYTRFERYYSTSAYIRGSANLLFNHPLTPEDDKAFFEATMSPQW